MIKAGITDFVWNKTYFVVYYAATKRLRNQLGAIVSARPWRLFYSLED